MGASALHVVSGEVVARSGDEVVLLREGDVLTVPPLSTVRVVEGCRPAEALVFFADGSWAERTLDLAGCGVVLSPAPFLVDRAESDGARRAVRILGELDPQRLPRALRRPRGSRRARHRLLRG